jgi:hypothetical protein
MTIIKEVIKGIFESIIIGALLVAFSQASLLFFFFAIIYSIIDVFVMIYSAYQGDPKFLIVGLLSHVITRGSK